jgi:glycosyltransferase involved in cell wall biosynthesis
LKRNVLHLINSFHQGGTERQAVQLARLLHESGRYRIHVACLDAEGVLREEIDSLKLWEIPEYRLTSFYNRNMMRQVRRFARLLRKREIDIVQTHDFYTNIFGMFGAALARTPVRIAARRETNGVRTRAQKMAERTAYKLADIVIANAEAVRRQLVAEGVPEEKTTTVYNGLDMQRVTPRADLNRDDVLAKFNVPGGDARRFVTIVANQRLAVKDHPTFLRAAQRVRAEVPGASFLLAGEGELNGSLRALAAQLGLEENAFFLGRCQDVAELLAISDVCVLSSKAEGFSNSILEYMAAARPVVATDVGGAREAIIENETGYLIQTGDYKALAARIIALLRDPPRARQMGERGRRIVEQKFSCEAQLNRTESIYGQLLTAKQTVLRESLQRVRRESASK